MRKMIFGRRFKRDTNARKALFKNLMASLILYGKIKTSEAKAKAIKSEIEKLLTHAKNNGDSARHLLSSRLTSDKVVDRLVNDIAPLFASRPGGYTRILKLGVRKKDGSKMVLMTWVEEVGPIATKEPKRNTKSSKGKTAKEEKVKKPTKKTAKK